MWRVIFGNVVFMVFRNKITVLGAKKANIGVKN